jgi:hypothetical protein
MKCFIAIAVMLAAGCGRESPDKTTPERLHGDWVADSLIMLRRIGFDQLYFATFSGDSANFSIYSPYQHFIVAGDTLRVMEFQSPDTYYLGIRSDLPGTLEFQILRLTGDSLWLLYSGSSPQVIRYHNTRLDYDPTLQLQRIVLSANSGFSAPWRYDVVLTRDLYSYKYSVPSDSTNAFWLSQCLESNSVEEFFNRVQDKVRSASIDSVQLAYITDLPSYSIEIFSNRGVKKLSGTSCGGGVDLLTAFLLSVHPRNSHPSVSLTPFEGEIDSLPAPPPQKYSRPNP